MKVNRPKKAAGAFTLITSAFTLIELLVVIAIIAILAAILFPVFAKAREKARQTACLSNEKQIALGLLQYEQDYDEMLPYLWYGTNGGGSALNGNYKWMDAVYPYIKSEAVFNCPDVSYPITNNAGTFYGYHYLTNLASQTPAAAGNAATTGNFYYGSYAINAIYRNDSTTLNRTSPCGAYGTPLNIAKIVSPASTVWVSDGVNYYSGSSTFAGQPNPIVNTTVDPPVIGNPTSSGNELIVARHTKFTNEIFCDGHAKSMSLQNLVANQRSDGTLINFIVEGQ